MPAFDVDIVNEDAARAVEDLVRERYADAGVLMTRIGRAPKRAFLFRADEVFDKIEVSLIDRGGKQGEKIEFLADGQQVVLFGVHPDTRRPYRWHGGKPGEIKLDDLPSIRQDEAQALIEAAAELLVRDFGYQPAPTRRKRREGNGAAAAEAAAGDWQFLIDNIHAGRQLHDSLRDLAAKLIASGMSRGAAVNHLRALMEGSTAPYDDRWKERYSRKFRAWSRAPRPCARHRPPMRQTMTRSWNGSRGCRCLIMSALARTPPSSSACDRQCSTPR